MRIITANDGPHKFSSTQIDAPKKIASAIQKWGKAQIADEDVYTDPDDQTLGREKDTHVTVKYGLHTNSPNEVIKLIEDFGHFTIKLGKVSKFSAEFFDVLKIEVHSEKLHELNGLISDNLECTDKHPKYQPHVTIAYVEKGSCDDLLGNDHFDGLSWVATAVKFSNKESEKTIISL